MLLQKACFPTYPFFWFAENSLRVLGPGRIVQRAVAPLCFAYDQIEAMRASKSAAALILGGSKPELLGGLLCEAVQKWHPAAV